MLLSMPIRNWTAVGWGVKGDCLQNLASDANDSSFTAEQVVL